MVKDSRIGEFGQAPERQRRLSSAPTRRELSSRRQRASPGLLDGWVAASAAVSQGILAMRPHVLSASASLQSVAHATENTDISGVATSGAGEHEENVLE